MSSIAIRRSETALSVALVPVAALFTSVVAALAASAVGGVGIPLCACYVAYRAVRALRLLALGLAVWTAGAVLLAVAVARTLRDGRGLRLNLLVALELVRDAVGHAPAPEPIPAPVPVEALPVPVETFRDATEGVPVLEFPHAAEAVLCDPEPISGLYPPALAEAETVAVAERLTRAWWAELAELESAPQAPAPAVAEEGPATPPADILVPAVVACPAGLHVRRWKTDSRKTAGGYHVRRPLKGSPVPGATYEYRGPSGEWLEWTCPVPAAA